MSKKTKKRTKRYQGEDAKQTATSGPVVHRYEAVERSRLGHWWQAKKRTVRLAAIITGVITLGGWLLTELFRTIF